MSSDVGPVVNGIPNANPNLAWGEAKHPGNRFANQFGLLGDLALLALLVGLAFVGRSGTRLSSSSRARTSRS